MRPDGERKTLIVELWGIGDGVLMTSALQALLARGRAATVLCAPSVRDLLAPGYPQAEFLTFRAPWTAFRGKYRLRRWPWLELIRVIIALRARRFDAALSARPDPRDHLLMWLAGARVRCGFPRAGSGLFLNRPVVRGRGLRHRVEDWNALVRALEEEEELPLTPPRLAATANSGKSIQRRGPALAPIVALHCGAGQPVRRWPVARWQELLAGLRERYGFSLVLIPDLDGFGRELGPWADRVVTDLSLAGLIDVLEGASLFLGNDSGPAHVAAALGVPAVAIFGPQHPELFAPFGPDCRAVARDLCPYRGCSDHCRFAEPHCLTRLPASEVACDVIAHIERLVAGGVLPSALRRGGAAPCQARLATAQVAEPRPATSG